MEAASPLGWERYVGDSGVIIGLDRFGASAPGDIIYQQLGLTARHMADEAQHLLGKE
jgi:transketolase